MNMTMIVNMIEFLSYWTYNLVKCSRWILSFLTCAPSTFNDDLFHDNHNQKNLHGHYCRIKGFALFNKWHLHSSALVLLLYSTKTYECANFLTYKFKRILKLSKLKQICDVFIFDWVVIRIHLESPLTVH